MRNDKSSVWVFCFFFKQKTAYEMRISDWSSDVCSSDLFERGFVEAVQHQHLRPAEQRGVEREAGVFGRGADEHDRAALDEGQEAEIGRASCRERVCPSVLISVVAVSFTKKTTQAKQLYFHNIERRTTIKNNIKKI